MARHQLRHITGSLIALSILVHSAAWGSGDLDQVFEPDVDNGPFDALIESYPDRDVSAAQSFTVGVSGVLSCIEVNIRNFNSSAGPLIVEVQSAENGLPTGTVLATSTLSRSEVPTELSYVLVDLSHAALEVFYGDQLAIVLRTEFQEAPRIPWYRWEGEAGSEATYNGGLASARTNDEPWTGFPTIDLGFRTYVDGPTPVVSTTWGEIKAQYQEVQQ